MRLANVVSSYMCTYVRDKLNRALPIAITGAIFSPSPPPSPLALVYLLLSWILFCQSSLLPTMALRFSWLGMASPSPSPRPSWLQWGSGHRQVLLGGTRRRVLDLPGSQRQCVGTFDGMTRHNRRWQAGSRSHG